LAVPRAVDRESGRQLDERGLEIRDAQGDVLERAALARAFRVEERQLAAPRIRAEQRELVGLIDHVHAETCSEECRDRLAVGEPVRDVVEPRRIHPPTVPRRLRVMRYFLESTARWSCCFVIRERPSMPIRFASL